MPATLTLRTWTRSVGASELNATAQHIGEGAVYVSDVLRAVLEELGDVVYTPITGDYPGDWVGIDFPFGTDGAHVRVWTVDLEVRGCALAVFDRNCVRAGGATFDNLPEHLVAAVVVAEATR